MQILSKSHLAVISPLILSAAAHATQPPDVVESDSLQNTAMGTSALLGLGSAGHADTASGFQALRFNTSGTFNTADGADALYENTSGIQNTAVGAEALYHNTTGSNNMACGMEALFTNTTGSNNTGAGYNTLYYNTTGSSNSASGVNALFANTVGAYNTASGMQALYKNTTGSANTATGYNSLLTNTTGTDNTASGYAALYKATGSSNIAIGYRAAYNVTTGSNNIDIGSEGAAADGVDANSGVIRIGTQSHTPLQTSTYIAGIYDNTTVLGLPVVIDSDGLLGTTSSSERFKTAIEPMGSNMAKLRRLRPVTFRYKADPQGTLRYGLIAEEVAKVFPELVVRDHNGRIDGVRYDELAPILLQELQEQDKAATAQAAELRDIEQHEEEADAARAQHAAAQDAKIRLLEQQLAEIRTALVELKSKDDVVARR